MHTGFLAVPALFSALRWQKKRLQNQWEKSCAGRQEEAAARPRYQPQHEGVGSSRMQGKGLEDWGKDAKGSPGRRLIRSRGHHQPCPLRAHQTSIKNLHYLFSLSAEMAWTSPQKSPFGESHLRSQSWVLGKWLLYFKRVAERKEQPQSKPLRNILQTERPSMGDSKTRPLAREC